MCNREDEALPQTVFIKKIIPVSQYMELFFGHVHYDLRNSLANRTRKLANKGKQY